MKSFKSFLIEQENQKLPGMMASFGSHSIPSKPTKPTKDSNQAVFGSHSQTKPKPKTSKPENKPDKFLSDPLISSIFQKEEKTPKKPPTTAEEQIHAHYEYEEYPIHDANKVKDSKEAVKEYTSDSTDINRSLFNHHKTGQHPKDYDDYVGKHRQMFVPSGNIYHVHDHIKRLDDVMNNHKIAKDTHVFTGVSRPPMEHFKGKTNKPVKVHFPAYTSTSTNFDVTPNFSKNAKSADEHKPLNTDAKKPKNGQTKHILKIHVPKGTPGGSVRHLSPYQEPENHSFEENEILLHRGLDMEIHHQPTLVNHPEHGHLTVWHARVVGHNPAKL
jgi:hypothetical protein